MSLFFALSWERTYNLLPSEFVDPDRDERLLYAKYWQNKLIDNDKVDFPDSLAAQISESTYGFSFAYLKECL